MASTKCRCTCNLLGQRRVTCVYETAAKSTRIPKTFPTDQSLDPNLVSLRDLSQPEDGAGDGNRTHMRNLKPERKSSSYVLVVRHVWPACGKPADSESANSITYCADSPCSAGFFRELSVANDRSRGRGNDVRRKELSNNPLKRRLTVLE
jgi:hypothetical protein